MVSSKNIQSINTVGIIDAGTMGTRLIIYKKTQTSLKVEKFTLKPGIDSVDLNGIEDYMNELLSKYKPGVDNVPLQFIGTESIRKLDKAKQNNIIRKLRSLLNIEKVRILSEYDEGVGTYNALKYITGDIQPFGVIEIGGGSIQFTTKENTKCFRKTGFKNPEFLAKKIKAGIIKLDFTVNVEIIYLVGFFHNEFGNFIGTFEELKLLSIDENKNILYSLLQAFELHPLQKIHILIKKDGLYVEWSLHEAIKMMNLQ